MRSDSFIRISEVLQREVRDARIWQIAALTLLLSWNLTSLSLGASLLPSLVAVASALGYATPRVAVGQSSATFLQDVEQVVDKILTKNSISVNS